MKTIESHLRLNLFVNTALAIIYFGSLLLGVAIYDSYNRDQRRASELEHGIFELTILSQDFLLSKSPRAANQLVKKFSKVRSQLSELKAAFNWDPQSSTLLANIDNNLAIFRSHFTQFENLLTSQPHDISQSRLRQLSSHSLYLAHQAAHQSSQLYIAAQRRSVKYGIIIVSLFFLIIALGKGLAFWVSRNLIHKTHASLTAISQGIAQLRRGEAFSSLSSSYYEDFSRILADFSMTSEILENRYKELVDEIARQKSQIEQASQAKSDFLANISHEIRTPLAIIDGFAVLISQLNETQSQLWANKIRWNVSYVTGLINDILDLAKIEAGKMEYNPREFATSDLGAVFSTLKYRAQQRGNCLIVKADTPLPRRITSNFVKLQQILMNIVGNAIKYTENGEIRVTLSFVGGLLRILVIDSGQGMTLESQKNLFNRFYRANSAGCENITGTGLGLILAREMANLLGGDVKLVKSCYGKGSRFEASIRSDTYGEGPSLTIDELLAEPPIAAATADTALSLRHMRVLLAEDSEDLRTLTSQRLTSLGAEVVAVCDGQAALEQALDPSARFDLVLLDIQMPRMDGYTAVHKLREQGYSGPIVACSARLMKDEKELGLAAGFTEYLEKPLDMDKMLKLYHDLGLGGSTSMTPSTSIKIDMGPLLERMLRNLPRHSAELAQSIRKRDVHQFRSTLHKLKGILSSYGFPQVAQKCADLEHSEDLCWRSSASLLHDLETISLSGHQP